MQARGPGTAFRRKRRAGGERRGRGQAERRGDLASHTQGGEREEFRELGVTGRWRDPRSGGMTTRQLGAVEGSEHPTVSEVHGTEQ